MPQVLGLLRHHSQGVYISMKKRMIVVIVILVCALSGCSFKQNNMAGTAEVVAFLTSDEAKGRLTGTEGSKKTEMFIAEQFHAAGLEPLLGENYCIPYTQMTYMPDKQKIDISVLYKNGELCKLDPGRDFFPTVGLSDFTINAGITTDYNAENISGTILLEPDSGKISDARETEPAALFIISGKASARIEEDQGIVPTFNLSADFMKRLLSEIESVASVSIDCDYSTVSSSVNNVAGVLKGKDPSKAVILSTHFDHIGWWDDTVFRGAADNAS